MYNTDSSPVGPAPTPISTVHGAINDARDLCRRIEDTVNNLIGAVPQAREAADLKAVVQPSVLGAMADNARSLDGAVRDATAALDRLDRSL